GKRILNNMKKLFAQIAASWLLSTKVMGGGFGNLFGSLIFGPGSTAANVFGGGAAGIGGLGLMGGLLGLGVPGAGGSVPFAGMPGGFFGSFSGSSSIPGAAGAMAGSAAGALTTPGIASSGLGGTVTATAATLAAPRLGASLGGLFSKNSLLGIGAIL